MGGADGGEPISLNTRLVKLGTHAHAPLGPCQHTTLILSFHSACCIPQSSPPDMFAFAAACMGAKWAAPAADE